MSYDYNQKSLQGLENEERAKKCPDCDSDKIEYENEEIICKNCGLVFE